MAGGKYGEEAYELRKGYSVDLMGKVIKGRGRASNELEVSMEEIGQLTGQEVVPGSLNVVLSRPVMLNGSVALKFDGGRRLLWPAEMNGLVVWIYRWVHAPLHVAEILADKNLRDALGLRDGGPVKLRIPKEFVERIPIGGVLTWYVLWSGRQGWSYHKEWYYAKTRPACRSLGATQKPS